MKIWIDGSGWNGKESKFCVTTEDGEIILRRLDKRLTNNEMEYMALLGALEIANEGDTIYTDSKLVEGQVVKGWKCTKAHLFPLMMRARKLVKQKGVELKWIPRKENKAGHLLEEEK